MYNVFIGENNSVKGANLTTYLKNEGYQYKPTNTYTRDGNIIEKLFVVSVVGDEEIKQLLSTLDNDEMLVMNRANKLVTYHHNGKEKNIGTMKLAKDSEAYVYYIIIDNQRWVIEE